MSVDDGLTWTEAASFNSAYNRSDWILRRVALDGYQGETMRMRAVQGSSWTSDVWVVDDVRIGEREALPDLGFPFADDMESGDSNWEPDGQWILVDDEAYSSTHAWSLNSAEEYQRNTDFALELAGQISIAGDAVDPQLSWVDHIEAAADTTLQIELSTNAGLDWTVLQTFTPTPSPTPEHTPTPTPTSTLTPTPTPTALAANRSMGSVALAAIVMQPVAPIPAPAAQAGEVEIRTIDYSYDPLYRLTGADYDDGTYFHYSYDAVGNRLNEGTNESSSTYAYDAANRLIDVDGVAYTWDANGNLLSDGSSYSYNTANRLVGVSQGGDAYTFAYNGLGDRLQQVVNGDTTSYTLDLNTGLTQVLADGTNAYLYGLGRVGEQQHDGWMYHLPDALGSVRQLANNAGTIDLAKAYTPFGSVSTELGEVSSPYGFTGEWVDGTGLTFLRARYLDGVGRFMSKDPWNGSSLQPMSYNPYLYTYNNPINLVDPSGLCEGSGYKYCRVLGGPYDGAIIDLDHFDDSRRIAKHIRDELLKEKGKDPGILEVKNSQAGILNLIRHYETHIPLNTPKPILDRITLGIFMDFQWSVETFQSIPCYAGIPCSGFANEDLPSDYLGFVVEILMPKNSSLNDILRELGADDGIPTSEKGIYESGWLDTYNCFHSFDCGEFNPYNKSCDWTFKLFVEDKGVFKYVNQPWPDEFQMEPIKRGHYWEPTTLFLFEYSIIR